jgi:hypothetical protein
MNKKIQTVVLTGEDKVKKDTQRKTSQLQFTIDETSKFNPQER